jgi:RNA polymerase sigma-70 factor (ECF subfamily)
MAGDVLRRLAVLRGIVASPLPLVALAAVDATAAENSRTDLPGPRQRAANVPTPARSGPGPTALPAGDLDPEMERIAALVTLAQRGDGEAFALIYDKYVDEVYRYLYYRTGSHPLAEDLTSETFLKALRRLDTFSWQGRDIGAWFITIARNLVIDHVKSASFRLEVSTADMIDVERPDDGLEEDVISRLEAAGLVDAIRRLKPEQQECVLLRFLQGLSVAETAHVMGRSEGAIKQLQLRAVRALARLVPQPSGGTA